MAILSVGMDKGQSSNTLVQIATAFMENTLHIIIFRR